MTMQVIAVNAEVRCSDGSLHQDVKLAVDGRRRICLTADGTEIPDVEAITKCMAIVPPMIFEAALIRCKEEEHG